MTHHGDPTMYAYRFFQSFASFVCILTSNFTRDALSETSEKILQATPPAIVPVSCYSWDIPSKPGSTSSTGSSPEIPSHTITSYNYSHRSDEQSPRGFSIAGHRYDARPHLLEYPPDLTFASIPFVGDPRTGLDQPFPRISVFKVVYTSDARMKLCEGVHRRCFNCRATETTTWRRSSLSLGKLVRLHSQ